MNKTVVIQCPLERKRGDALPLHVPSHTSSMSAGNFILLKASLADHTTQLNS